MSALALLIRAGVRGRWRALGALAVITTLACGFVLTAANGARRTETSWSRLQDATDAPNALVAVLPTEVDAARRTIAARDDVAGVAAFSWIPASVEGIPGGDIGLFAGLGDGFGETIWRPLVERGRLADPDRADEITVNQAYADLAGIDLGDRVRLTGPKIDQPATVVGIHRSALDIGPNGGEPSGVATPAFMARWWPEVTSLPGFDFLRPAIGVRFTDGTDVAEALEGLAASLPADAAVVGPDDLDEDVHDGLRAGTNAYWILTIASAIGSLVLLSLLVVRVLRSQAEDSERLAALGLTGPQRAAAAGVAVAVAVTVGVAVAPFLARAASPLVRTGFAKLADPEKGVWIDSGVAARGAGLLAFTLLAVVAVLAIRITAVHRGAPAALLRPTRIKRLGMATPAAVLGVNAAFGGMRASTRRLARTTLLASIGTVALVVAPVVWLSSAARLTNDYSLQGWGFEAVARAAADATAEQRAAASEALAARPDVVGMSAFTQRSVPSRGVDVDVFGMTGIKRSVPLALRRGRAPAGPNEVAVGPLALRGLGLTVGDDVVLGEVTLTIVGEVIFPALGTNGFGGGLLMSEDTARQFGDPLNGGFLIDLAPGADLAPIRRAAGEQLSVSSPSSPPPIVRVRDVRGIAAALAAYFATLGLVVFTFGIISGGHQQHRELAVMRAVGFRRRGVRAAFRWQGLLVLTASVLVGLPLGAALGRTAWRLTSRNLGVLDAYRVPPAELAAAGAFALMATLAIAALAARRPAQASIAVGLRTE